MGIRSHCPPQSRRGAGSSNLAEPFSAGRTMIKWLIKRLLMAMAVMLALGLIGGGALLALLHHYGQQLPDYRQLANYEPPTVTRLHAGDGQLLAEYATEKRIFVPIEAIPRRVVEAFLAAEDKNFYTHSGVD